MNIEFFKWNIRRIYVESFFNIFNFDKESIKANKRILLLLAKYSIECRSLDIIGKLDNVLVVVL
jgi:hypothetical protein